MCLGHWDRMAKKDRVPAPKNCSLKDAHDILEWCLKGRDGCSIEWMVKEIDLQVQGTFVRNLSQWKFRGGTGKGRSGGRDQRLCLLGPLKASTSPCFFLSFDAILCHPKSLLPFHFP